MSTQHRALRDDGRLDSATGGHLTRREQLAAVRDVDVRDRDATVVGDATDELQLTMSDDERGLSVITSLPLSAESPNDATSVSPLRRRWC